MMVNSTEELRKKQGEAEIDGISTLLATIVICVFMWFAVINIRGCYETKYLYQCQENASGPEKCGLGKKIEVNE